MRNIRQTICLVAAVLCISGNLWAYSGGTGESNDPYQIANVADFNQLTIDDPNWNKSFILTADVNLAGVTLTPVGNDSTYFVSLIVSNYRGCFDSIILPVYYGSACFINKQ